MDSRDEIVDPPLEIHGVVAPRLAVDPRCGQFLQVEEARSEKLRSYVVQQVGELQLPILTCRFPYTQQSTRSGSGLRRTGFPVPALHPVQ